MRGKKAAGAASRQASRTAAEVIAFQAAIAAEKSARVADGVAHAAEVALLRAEVQSRAAEMLDATVEVRIASEVDIRVVAELRSTNEARARKIFSLLAQAIPPDLPITADNDEFGEILRVMGVPHLFGELFQIIGHRTSSRAGRRVTTQDGNKRIQVGLNLIAKDPVSVAQRRKKPSTGQGGPQ